MRITKSQIRKIIREEMSLGRNLGYNENEGRYTKAQLHHISNYASELHDMINDEDDLPEWVQGKISNMAFVIGKMKHYLEYKIKRMDNPNLSIKNDERLDLESLNT